MNKPKLYIDAREVIAKGSVQTRIELFLEHGSTKRELEELLHFVIHHANKQLWESMLQLYHESEDNNETSS